MKNMVARLLLAITVLPLLAVCVFLLPYFNHIGVAVIVIAASTLSSFELAQLFRKKGINVSLTLAVAAGFLLPTLKWFTDNPDLKALSLPAFVPSVALTLFGLLLLATEIINTTQEQFSQSLTTMGAHLMLLFYPAYLSTYFIQLAALPNSDFILFVFFTLVFTNDSFAYFSGMLFGKKTWKPFPVSPHKSILGFIGGFFFTIAAGAVLYACNPAVFNHKIYWAFILAVFVSLFANIGDLVESAIKRSADVKDSGHWMLGRGGLLDCVDSLLFSAPVVDLFFEHIIQTVA